VHRPRHRLVEEQLAGDDLVVADVDLDVDVHRPPLVPAGIDGDELGDPVRPGHLRAPQVPLRVGRSVPASAPTATAGPSAAVAPEVVELEPAALSDVLPLPQAASSAAIPALPSPTRACRRLMERPRSKAVDGCSSSVMASVSPRPLRSFSDHPPKSLGTW